MPNKVLGPWVTAESKQAKTPPYGSFCSNAGDKVQVHCTIPSRLRVMGTREQGKANQDYRQ